MAIVDVVQMSALVPTAELKEPGQFVCSFNVVWTLPVARGLAHDIVFSRRVWKEFMTFVYYAGPDAAKGLQRLHGQGERVSKNAPRNLEGIIFSEFCKKVAAGM